MYKIKNTRLISESRISIYTKYFIVPPGNIRELQHTIEKAVILCEGDVIRSKDIFVKQTWSPQFSTTVPNLEEVERQAIETAIRQNDGNLTATAEQLGISRQTLYNKIKRFKL